MNLTEIYIYIYTKNFQGHLLDIHNIRKTSQKHLAFTESKNAKRLFYAMDVLKNFSFSASRDDMISLLYSHN